MKTKIEIEYDYDQPESRRIADGILNADEAWNALHELREMVIDWKNSDFERGGYDEMLKIINETRLDKVWK